MLRRKFKELKKGAKILFVGLLVTSLVCTTTGIGSLITHAVETNTPSRRIVAFDPLPAGVSRQVLPVGASESDIVFPTSIGVTVGTTVQTLYGGTEQNGGAAYPSYGTGTNGTGVNGTGTDGTSTQNGATGTTGNTAFDGNAAGEPANSGAQDQNVSGGTENTEQPAGTEGAQEAGNGGDAAGQDSSNAGNDTGSAGENTAGNGTDDTQNSGNGEGGTDGAAGNGEASPSARLYSEKTGAGLTAGAGSIFRAVSDLLLPSQVYAAESGTGADGTAQPGTDADQPSQPEENANAQEGSASEGSQEPAAQGTETQTSTPAVQGTETQASTANGERVVTTEESYRATVSGLTWMLVPGLSAASYFSSDASFYGSTFVYVPDVSLYAIADGVQPPMLTVTIGDGTANGASAAFAESVLSGGMEIRVTAPAGVFPAGSRLVVTPLSDSYRKQSIESAIEGEISDGENEVQIEESISFDITIVDADGREIEPDTTYGYVNVEFNDLSALGEIGENNELRVFHFDESEGLEELPAVIDGSSASVLADSFSVYTVAKTYASQGINNALNPLIMYDGQNNMNDRTPPSVRITANGYVISKYSNGPYSASYLMVSNSSQAHTQTETLWFLDTATWKQNSINVVVGFLAAGFNDITGTVNWGLKSGLVYNGGEQTLVNDGAVSVTGYDSYYQHKFRGINDANNMDLTYTYTVGTGGTGDIPKGLSVGTYNFLGEVLFATNDRISENLSVSIAPCPLTDSHISVTPASITAPYNVDTLPSTFQLVLTKPDATTYTLVKDTDYTVDLSGCAAPASGTTATGTIRVTGKGNFTGTRDITVTLTGNTADTPDPIAAYDGSTTLASQYRNKVAISTTNGYQVSNSATGPFANSYDHTTVGNNQSVTLYFKNAAGNVIKKTLTGITVVVGANRATALDYRYNDGPWKEWFNTDVKLTADGYVMDVVDPLVNTTLRSYYMFTAEGYNAKHLYFNPAGTGAGAAAVDENIEVAIDRTAPTGYMEVKNRTFDSFTVSDDPTVIMRTEHEIGISGSDALSGVASIGYYVSSKQYNNTTDLEKAMESAGWRTYSASAKPVPRENAVSFVYAKITDKAGNYVYRATGGILWDSKAPDISKVDAAISDKKATVTVNATDNMSGVTQYYLIYTEKGADAPTKENLENAYYHNDKGIFTIENLDETKTYVFYAMAEDKAGNQSEIGKKELAPNGTSNLKPAPNGNTNGSAKTGLTPAANGIAGSGGGAGGAGGKNGANGTNAAGTGASGEKAKGAGDEEERVISRTPYIASATGDILVGEAATGGWDKIDAQMDKAPDENSLSVEMSGLSVIPGRTLNTLTGRGLEVTFLMPQDVEWTINGKDMEESRYEDMDLGVTLNSKGIPTELINSAADTWPHTDFAIAYSGSFGFPATLSVPIESGTDMYANLFYYDKEAQELKFMQSVQIGADSRAVFNMNHASEYTIVVRDRPMLNGGVSATVGGAETYQSEQEQQDALLLADDETQTVSAPLLKSVTGGKSGMHLWLFLIALISAVLCGMILFLPAANAEREKVRVKPRLPKLDEMEDRFADKFGDF